MNHNFSDSSCCCLSVFTVLQIHAMVSKYRCAEDMKTLAHIHTHIPDQSVVIILPKSEILCLTRAASLQNRLEE